MRSQLQLLMILSLWTIKFSPAMLTFDPRLPARKTWWAKHVTDDVFTAGRLTESEIKYAAEDGFKSIVSMFHYARAARKGDEIMPSTNQSRTIATELAEIKYAVVIKNGGFNWRNLQTVTEFGNLYNKLPKPILFHCGIGFSSTFITLLYFSKVNHYQTVDSEDTLAGNDFYFRSSALGYDYTETHLVELVRNVTGNNNITLNKPHIALPEWDTQYWHLKPVYENWFISGQIQSNHLDLIWKTGISSILNVRMGVTSAPHDRPSQEEVTLLNIADNTGTYATSGRQSIEELTRNRLDDSKPNAYISNQSVVNYQSINELQFGDDIGYNETSERTAIEEAGFDYYHTPIPIGDFSLEMYTSYKSLWIESGSFGTVLVHSQRGYRAVVVALLGAAIQYNKTQQWALQRAEDMGFHLETNTQVLRLFHHVLGGEELFSGHEHKTYCSHLIVSCLFVFMFALRI